MKRALLLLVLLVACTRKEPPPSPPVEAEASALAPVSANASELVEKSCLSCHTEQMLEQQRLTEAQWTKVVTKMVSWGANLEPSEQPALVAYLSSKYGLDSGAYPTQMVDETELTAALVPTLDGLFAGGSAERGKPLFIDRCSGCHNADARGHIGVNLVDRPFLYRADELARTIRRGRGKMPAAKITDPEVADILAHLRTLR